VQRAADPAHNDDDNTIRDILRTLRARTSHDFSDYKPATIRRRIARRMSLHQLDSLTDYARYLKGHADEAGALMKDLLISVTNFFRDGAAWTAPRPARDPPIVRGP
jgi:two-component system CheB/CheR fusion protein